jgi:inner membrane protein
VLQTRIARGVAAALLLLAGAWIISTGLIPLASGVLLVSVTLAMLAVGYFASKRAAVVTGLGVWATATFMFILTQQVAQARVESFTAERYPQATTVNQALSPMPTNPVCWEVVLTQLEGERYTIRRAMLSLAPEWVPAAVCPQRRLNDPTTAPLAQSADSGDAHWKWFGELPMRFDVLAQLSATRCEAAAFMRFARAPWAAPVENRWILGDLRYDREPELGFSEIELTADVRCPMHTPPWVTPVMPFIEQRLRSQQLTSGTPSPDAKTKTAAP